MMASKLLKTITLGPYSVQEYKKLKLKKYKEDSDEMVFLIDFIYNTLGNNIISLSEIRKYYLENEKIITDIEYHYTKRVRTITRHISKFGSACDSESNTVVGEPVWISPININANDYNHEMRKKYYKLEKKLNLYRSRLGDPYKISETKKTEHIQKTYTTSSGFQVFKPNKNFLNMVKTEKVSAPGTYRPPGVTSGGGKSSLVIKNIPTYLSSEVVYTKLRNIFSKYGGINKMNVLSDKNDSSKIAGIAFIDFYGNENIEKILASDKKYIIEHNILLLEKSKKKS
tara:strand:+ start:117 stop:971 length:855 start_codon:yes stop_codon:yes gene_type:complete